MEQQRKRKKPHAAWLLAIILPVLLVYAANRFLNTDDGYGHLTGWQVVNYLPHFWLWVSVGIFGCLVFLVIAYCNETGSWFGKNMSGSMGLNFLFIILAMVCLFVPWLKATAIKTDGRIDIHNVKTTHETRTNNSTSIRSICSYSTYGVLT